jgi:WS/DGAT C-terminal domain
MRQLTSLDAQFLARESSHMDFGIVADRDQMPDLWAMLDRLRDSLEELK